MEISKLVNNIERNIKGCSPDIKDSKDHKIKRPLKSFIKAVLPESITNVDYVNIIDNQGDEGVCVSASSTKAMELAYLRDKNTKIDFSIRYLYEIAKVFDEWEGNDYEGTSIRGAMKGLKKMGCCEEQYLKYIPKEKVEIKKITASANIMNNADKYKIVEYFSLFGIGSVNIWKLKKAVFDYGFAICGFYLPNSFGDKIIYTKQYDSDVDFESGHAMLIAGYTKEGVIIVNSWGKDFGQNGVCYMDWELFKYCCFSAWTFEIGLK